MTMQDPGGQGKGINKIWYDKINHIHDEDIRFLNSLSIPAGVACE